MQGYTGLLNTPNALVTEESQVDVLYTNHFDAAFPTWVDSVDSYLFSMGVLPSIELGGRLIALHDPNTRFKGRRDLSGNVKWQFFNPTNWPSLAMGYQDFGGEATLSRARYVVATKQLSPLRVSAGYGFGPDRMEGAFGGVEFRITKWLYGLAEYDTNEMGYGVRVTSHAWRHPIALSFTAKKAPASQRDDTYYGLGLRIPLGRDTRDKDAIPLPEPGEDNAASKAKLTKGGPRLTTAPETVALSTLGPMKVAADPIPNTSPHNFNPARVDVSAETTKTTDVDGTVALHTIHELLKDLGFEKLRVGMDKTHQKLFVQYENNRYNHNELDGLGLVLGVAATRGPIEATSLTVLSHKHGIPILEVTTSVDGYKRFLRGPASEPLEISNELPQPAGAFSLKITAPKSSYDYSGITFINPSPKWRLRSELYIYPQTVTFVGSELGLVDASVALRPDWYLRLWKGAALNLTWQKEIYHTNDFEKRKTFEQFKLKDGLVNILFHQTFKPLRNLMTLTSAGQFGRDYLAVYNDTIYHVPFGPFRVRTRLGYFDHQDVDDQRKVAVGSLRYWYARKNMSFEASFGQFWFEDRAVLLEAARYFGDTKITLFYKNNDNQAGGLRISIPLTPRRDTGPSMLQIKGANRWTYSLQTSMSTGGRTNPVDTRIATTPMIYHNLEHIYQNQGRLNERYIRANVLRLRNAYRTWVVK